MDCPTVTVELPNVQLTKAPAASPGVALERMARSAIRLHTAIVPRNGMAFFLRFRFMVFTPTVSLSDGWTSRKKSLLVDMGYDDAV